MLCEFSPAVSIISALLRVRLGGCHCGGIQALHGGQQRVGGCGHRRHHGRRGRQLLLLLLGREGRGCRAGGSAGHRHHPGLQRGGSLRRGEPCHHRVVLRLQRVVLRHHRVVLRLQRDDLRLRRGEGVLRRVQLVQLDLRRVQLMQLRAVLAMSRGVSQRRVLRAVLPLLQRCLQYRQLRHHPIVLRLRRGELPLHPAVLSLQRRQLRHHTVVLRLRLGELLLRGGVSAAAVCPFATASCFHSAARSLCAAPYWLSAACCASCSSCCAARSAVSCCTFAAR